MSTYRPDPAFAALFSAFTGGQPQSIGTQLTELMKQQSADQPLLVSTASDIALFPGGGQAPRIESFRKSTRGFIELTAVSHLPLAICYVARMRELQPGAEAWREQLRFLKQHALQVRSSNTVAMWREQVALQAFDGAEDKLTRLVDYTLRCCVGYIDRALESPGLLDFPELSRRFIDAGPDELPVNMNDVMFATFGLAYVDIAYRIGGWLRAQSIDWGQAMVLVSGQSGRPTAGVTWASNNMCNLIWKSSGERLAPDRLFVAPHAPALSVERLPDAAGLLALEQAYRHAWCHTRASIDVSRRMFDGHEAYSFEPATLRDMPPLRDINDHAGCVARLRRIMEDPQQLLSNCVADYIVDELIRCDQQPERVRIPGFTNQDYLQM